MIRLLLVLVVVIGAFVGLVAAGNLGIGPFVITRADQQNIILLFGDPRRVTQPGISLRIPFLEEADPYDRRWLYLNTEPLPIQTKDEERIVIDNYAVWRISDPVAFRRAFQPPESMAKANRRIDRTVRTDVREVIGQHTLAEVLKEKRGEVMESITHKTAESLAPYGIEVGDVRINRTELPEGTERNVYARMETDRQRLARRNRARGEEEARRIRADADREARVIVAEARREAEVAMGTGDAEATRIYAEAYSLDPEFYGFLRSLEAYRKTIDENTTLVLSPDSEFFRFLESSGPSKR